MDYNLLEFSRIIENGIYRYWLSNSKIFQSDKEIKDGFTYISKKNGKWYCIEKYDGLYENTAKRRKTK